MSAGPIQNAPIGSLIEKVASWNPVRDAPEDQLNYIDLSAVDNALKSVIDWQSITGREAPSRARQRVKAGDILVSTVRPNLNGVARVPANLDGATASTGFCVLRPKTVKLDASYLFHWVQSSAFVGDMVRKATGASYPAISDKIIGQSEIPLPPLDEQKRIATILDQADELRRKRQRALDRLNQLGQAIFHEMFGGAGSEEGSWSRKPLGELCDLVRGSSPRPQGDPRYFGGNIPRLMIADITRDGMTVTPKIDSLTDEGAKKSRAMPAGGVVMAVSGAVGLPAILAVDACIHDGFVGFRNLDNSILSKFLYWFLLVNRDENKAQGTGAIWVNLTTDQVKRFSVPVPPMDVQKQFSRKMDELQVQADALSLAFADSHRLFSSLQHRAFRGEL